jgi:hypothetical protein
VNRYDAFQFALDQGTTFWGHMLVDNACVKDALTNSHPDLVKAGLDGFRAGVHAERSGMAAASIRLTLQLAGGRMEDMAAVDFEGFYFGDDENGDTQTTDWHGFTKNRQPPAVLGTATQAPFEIAWDIAMLPCQKGVAVRATVHFTNQTNLVYVTAPRTGLEIPARPGRQVTLYSSHDLPRPFWSRAGQKRECAIYLDVNPNRIERAELHVNAWTGGSGEVKDYFKLNGRPYPVAEGARHELVYSRLPMEPSALRQGLNRIELLSSTEHHGIEILLPGPCLMVRSRQD